MIEPIKVTSIDCRAQPYLHQIVSILLGFIRIKKTFLHQDSSQSKPFRTISSIFPALLNLSTQIKKFGPPRSIWGAVNEGGCRKAIDATCKYGIASDNWDVYLLDIFYFHRSIDYGLCTPTGGDDQHRNIVVMSGMLQTMEGML